MPYLVDIDFDTASIAWRSNKIYLGNGSYRYGENPISQVEKSSPPPKPRYNLRHRPKTNRDSQSQTQIKETPEDKNTHYNLRPRPVNIH